MLLLAPAVAAAQADLPAADLAAALSGGDLGLSLRYRWEHVDQEGIDSNANASTLRLRLNYGTLPYRAVRAFIEFDYVAELLADDFNSGADTSPNRTRYPVVADPDGTDLNQLYLDYSGIPDTAVRVGRQRILLDNQRFVGGVGWRQNEQTYDGITIKYNGLAKTAVTYAYLARVNRIFGDRSSAGRNDSSTHLLNANLLLPDGWTLAAYGYRIDNDDVPAFSTLTLGASLSGSIPVGERSMSLRAEMASQSDAANAPVNFRAGYFRFDAGMKFGNDFSAALGYEVLEGDRGTAGGAFRTPLATLHAFQGWADQFLSTPDAGIEDLFATIKVSPGAWDLAATWHRFSAEDGGADWGDEIDVSAGRKLGKHYGLLLKAALFNADDASFSDVSKFWLMLTANY